MIVSLWRDIREAYHDAVQNWVAQDNESAILLLKLAIKGTENLIIALEKGVGHGKDTDS